MAWHGASVAEVAGSLQVPLKQPHRRLLYRKLRARFPPTAVIRDTGS